MNDILYLQTRFTDILNGIIKDSLIVFSAFLALLFVHWQTAFLFFVFAHLLLLLLWGGQEKKIAFYAESFQQYLAKIADHILDIRKRFDFISSQNGQKLELERFINFNTHYFRLMLRSIFVRASFAPIMEFLGFCLFAVFLSWASLKGEKFRFFFR